MTTHSPDGNVIACALEPTPAQRQALDATLDAFTAACRQAMQEGRAASTTANAVIHRLCYQELREQHGLSANLTIRAIARAARRLKGEPGEEVNLSTLEECTLAREDPSRSSVDYDARIISLSVEALAVSLSTVEGRVKGIRMTLDPKQAWRLRGRRPRRATLTLDPDRGYWIAIELVRPASNGAGAAEHSENTA